MSEGERKTMIRRALIGGRVLWGVDYPLAVGNLTLAVMLVVVGHIYWWVLAAIGIHRLLGMAHRADPDMFKVYLRYAKQGHRYEPWAHPDSRNRRPGGWL
ncbi:VirB3 family type IV secretion system protein [Acidihalobacter prosperus]|nr:VirB3 family type IV secretion system protein [Acidihalobacter prosperus]